MTLIALEKNNDDARRNFNSSNRLDAAKEIIVTDARLESLRGDCAREKRPYSKTNNDYWEKEIFEKRIRRDEEDDGEDVEEDVGEGNVGEGD